MLCRGFVNYCFANMVPDIATHVSFFRALFSSIIFIRKTSGEGNTSRDSISKVFENLAVGYTKALPTVDRD